jgi:hypothetical protein
MAQKALYEAVKMNFESIADARIAEKKRDERFRAKAAEAGLPLTDEDGNDVVQALVNDLLSTIFPPERAPEPDLVAV